MDNPKAVNGSGGDKALISEKAFQSKLTSLVKQWRAHNTKGLEIRHQTGLLLNAHFGPPTERQTRGEGVLNSAAEQLQTTVSELSRMRWFAVHFRSVEDLNDQHPRVKSWTSVKELLPKLMPGWQPPTEKSPESAETSQDAPKEQVPPFTRLKQSLAELSSTVQEIPQNLPAEEKQDLLAKVRKFVEVVTSHLGIQVSVGPVSAEETLPAEPDYSKLLLLADSWSEASTAIES